jgi:hypothetical protein
MAETSYQLYERSAPPLKILFGCVHYGMLIFNSNHQGLFIFKNRSWNLYFHNIFLKSF